MSARVTAVTAAAIVGGLAGPAYAAASQCAQFETASRGTTTEYQPFDASPTVDTFDIRAIVNNGVGSVRFLLVDGSARGGGPAIGDTGPVNYDILWLADTSKRVLVQGQEQPVAMAGAVVSPKNKSGQAIATFQLVIPAGQEAAARAYQENLTVRFQCLDGNGQPMGGVQEQYVGVYLAVTVPAYAAAYIGSVGQTRGTIDFGDLGSSDADVTRSIGVTALSTTPYEIHVVAEQNSRLLSPGNGGAAIPFKMHYGGQEVASNERVICPMTRAPMGTTEQFAVTLDGKAVASQPAGAYRGSVILTFAPRDIIAANNCSLTR